MKMNARQLRSLVGRRIVDVNPQARRIGDTWVYSPILRLDDGTSLVLSVNETEVAAGGSDYGIDFLRVKRNG